MKTMRAILIFTVVTAAICTLSFYVIINYLIFGDFGLVPAGRIVFGSIYGYFDYLLLPLSIFAGMCMIKFRYTENSDFKSLLQWGKRTAVVAAATFSIFIFCALEMVPDYFPKLVELMNSVDVAASGPTDFQRHMLKSAGAIAETPLLRSSVFYTGANFIVYSLLGLFSAYTSAFFLRTKKTNR